MTRKAAELAARHGVDLEQIDKAGFITADDVEAIVAGDDEAPPAGDPVLAGLSTENVTLPAVFSLGEDVGVLDPAFLATLRADPAAFGALASEEKVEAYRRAGAHVGEGVRLGSGTVVVAPRIVLEDGVTIGDGGSIRCDEVFAAGELAAFGPRLEARLPPRLRRRGPLGGTGDPDRRRRPPRPVGDVRDRRPRLHRRRGVHQRRPARPDRARGVRDHALRPRHAQHRPLAARGLREPLRRHRARGPGAGRHRGGRLRRLPHRARVDRRLELVRRRRHPGRLARRRRARTRRGCVEPAPEPAPPGRRRPSGSSTSSPSSSGSAASRPSRSSSQTPTASR